MKNLTWLILVLTLTLSQNCLAQTVLQPFTKTPFVWENATIYVVKTTDAKSGEFARISKKIEDGYFERLGVTAISLSNVFEQLNVAQKTDNFAYDRPFDWTATNSNFGTESDFAELISKAHKRNIRVLLNLQVNHVGASSLGLSPWPTEWVRTEPICTGKSVETTTSCIIDKSLSDIKTESDIAVQLPRFLIEKWQREDRLDREIKEIDAFFQMTEYPRAPRFYIIKWVTDYIRDYGIDGFIVDNVEHVESQIWGELKSQSNMAFAEWKQRNSAKVLDDKEFYMIGNVQKLARKNKGVFDYGNKKVNYYENGFNNLLNADFISDAEKGYEFLFAEYSSKLNNELEGQSITNYIADQTMFQRNKTHNRSTMLLLSPGVAQISSEPHDNTELAKDYFSHLEKLANFRKDHPAVGAGIHQRISTAPYVFSRGYTVGKLSDRVIIGIDLPPGKKELHMASLFKNNTIMRDAYSGKEAIVKSGRLVIDTPFTIVLLEEK